MKVDLHDFYNFQCITSKISKNQPMVGKPINISIRFHSKKQKTIRKSDLCEAVLLPIVLFINLFCNSIKCPHFIYVIDVMENIIAFSYINNSSLSDKSHHNRSNKRFVCQFKCTFNYVSFLFILNVS